MYNNYPYLLFLLFLIFLLVIEWRYKGNKIRIWMRIITSCSFVLFFGFRGYVGTDWYNYETSYQLTSWKVWLLTDYEIGFSALVKTLKALSFPYFYAIAVITGIQTLLFDNLVSKTSRSIVFPYILLIALFPIVVIDLQRNFLAILIAMHGVLYLQNGKTAKFYLLVLLATLFHFTSVVFFILPFLNRKRFSTVLLSSLLVLGCVIYAFQINFYQPVLTAIGELIGGRTEHLINQVVRVDEYAYGFSIGIVEKAVLFLVILLTYSQVEDKQLIFVNCCIVYILVYFYFSTSQSFINRFANLFMFGYLWYYAYAFITYRSSKLYSLFIVFILSFCMLRTYASYSPEIYRYVNILITDEDYSRRVDVRDRHYIN